MPVRGTQSHDAFLEWQEMLSCLGFSPSQIESCKDTKMLCSMTKANRRMRIVSLTYTRIKGKNPDGAMKPDKLGSYPGCATY